MFPGILSRAMAFSISRIYSVLPLGRVARLELAEDHQLQPRDLPAKVPKRSGEQEKALLRIEEKASPTNSITPTSASSTGNPQALALKFQHDPLNQNT